MSRLSDKEANRNKMREELTETLFTSVDVPDILEAGRQLTGASNFNFRVLDWENKSLVFPGEWLASTTTNRPELEEPGLGRRVVIDDHVDCIVGRVAHRFMDPNIKYDSKDPTKYLFNNLKEDTDFKDFVDRMEGQRQEKSELAKIWTDYHDAIVKERTQNEITFFKKCMEYDLPEQVRRENIKRLWSFLGEEQNLGNLQKIDAFVEEVERTATWYKKMSSAYEEYVKLLITYDSEIAIPVAAGNGLLGILNAHKPHGASEFSRIDVREMQGIATALTKALFYNRNGLLRGVQDVQQRMTSKWTFEEIASEVAKGIRTGLRGLGENEIYPLLYTPTNPSKPIRDTDNLEERFGSNTWKFWPRQVEVDDPLAEPERRLGGIEVSDDGLGRYAMDKWQDAARLATTKRKSDEEDSKLEAVSYFGFCDEVDNLNNGTHGSPSALREGIKATGCLPLAFEGKVYGLLYLHCTRRYYFTNHELSALELFGNQIAVAIKNAELLSPIKQYEEMYGSYLLDEFDDLPFDESDGALFNRVSGRLKEWAVEVRGARGTTISECVKTVIDDLSSPNYLDLPDGFFDEIEEYEKREGALQVLENYRDHFIHAFHVFCLGHILFCKWNKSNAYPCRFVSGGSCYGDDDAKLWFVTSIWHDLGYPAEKFESLVHDFFQVTVGRKIESQFDWSSILLAPGFIDSIEKLDRLFRKKHEASEIDFRRWLIKRLFEKHDHGVLSALMLLSKVNDQNKLDEDIALEAALAIALHNFRNSKVESTESADDDDQKGMDLRVLAVGKLQLAFLLSYCDDAQEWGRNVLLAALKRSPEINAPGSIKTSNKAYLSGINIQVDRGKVTTEVELYHNRKGDDYVGEEHLEDIIARIGVDFKRTWKRSDGNDPDFVIKHVDCENHGCGDYYPSTSS